MAANGTDTSSEVVISNSIVDNLSLSTLPLLRKIIHAPTITELVISNIGESDYSDETLKLLAGAISDCELVTKLKLEFHCSRFVFPAVVKPNKISQNLQYLDIVRANTSLTAYVLFCKALEMNTTLKTICVDRFYFYDESKGRPEASWATIIASAVHLEHLDIFKAWHNWTVTKTIETFLVARSLLELAEKKKKAGSTHVVKGEVSLSRVMPKDSRYIEACSLYGMGPEVGTIANGDKEI